MAEVLHSPTIGQLQERAHGDRHDYTKGSPHIRHHQIRERVISGIHALVGEVIERNGRCRVLEVGAGHGTFTDHLVAAGAEVQVTEISAPSAAVLRHRFRNNPHVTILHDPDGKEIFRTEPLDAVVCISVLHHVPDYLGAVRHSIQRIAAGGAFFSIQDPLWYPRRTGLSMNLDRGAYLLWRLGQGEWRRGLATRVRRLRGCYDETNEADMAEYHVVRKGVDEVALRALLEAAFHEVELQRYWSTQSGALQTLGERFAPPTTFGLLARNRR